MTNNIAPGKTGVQAIPAADAIGLLGQAICIDVRSPGEFEQGSLPHSINLPILNDEERHRVGLCYKEQGQAAAIRLGHELVGPYREDRVRAWCQTFSSAKWRLVTCWRGGLRSQTASAWLRGAGVESICVEGGYKAMRRQLLAAYDRLPELIVLAGATGSGKTRLLSKVAWPRLDLEGIACHRGSAFGVQITAPQPSQATFENAVALELLRQGGAQPLLIEDESHRIGRVELPPQLRKKITEAGVVVFQVPIEERVTNIFDEYVAQAFNAGTGPETLCSHYRQCLNRIGRKLGGAMMRKIDDKIQLAFSSQDVELHRDWIRDLLVHYYDRLYQFSFERLQRTVLFEGDWNECQNWIQKRFV